MKEIKIRAQILANPEVCRFSLQHPVYPPGLLSIKDPKSAESSPFLKELFQTLPVREVMLGPNSITVHRSSNREWTELAKEIGALIRKHIDGEAPLVSEDFAPPEPEEVDLRTAVEQYLREKINPALASHGGFAELKEFKDNVAYISFGGGCQGCSAANLTLSNHIRRQLFAAFPQLKDVVDVTEHHLGTNPYY